MARKFAWNPIRTAPRDKIITLLTVTGMTCRGRIAKDAKIRLPDRIVKVRRINAKRMDASHVVGDIRAVAWR